MAISNACLNVLRLSAVKGLGLKYFHRLYSHFGSVDAILNASHENIADAGVGAKLLNAIERIQVATLEQAVGPYADALLKWEQERENRYVLCLEDDLYPSMLREIHCPPPMIYLEGRLEALLLPSMAIVGSRKSTIKAAQHAQRLAKELAQSGCCITSGLALGIDAAAHRGALQAGGMTCGVMATGLDVMYPRQHLALAQQMLESGLLLSEMKLGTRPMPNNFPRRNRLISGLSHGVLVVEASLKSGSLITAKYALEQNREIFAMPGSIDNPASKGCHQLIKQGAKLVENLTDIVEEFSAMSGAPAAPSLAPETAALESDVVDPVVHGAVSLSADERVVLNAMAYDNYSFDELLASSKLDVVALTQVLIALELKQVLVSQPGGYQRLNTVKF